MYLTASLIHNFFSRTIKDKLLTDLNEGRQLYDENFSFYMHVETIHSSLREETKTSTA